MKITLNKQSKKYFGNVSVRNDCLLSFKIFFLERQNSPDLLLSFLLLPGSNVSYMFSSSAQTNNHIQ